MFAAQTLCVCFLFVRRCALWLVGDEVPRVVRTRSQQPLDFAELYRWSPWPMIPDRLFTYTLMFGTGPALDCEGVAPGCAVSALPCEECYEDKSARIPQIISFLAYGHEPRVFVGCLCLSLILVCTRQKTSTISASETIGSHNTTVASPVPRRSTGYHTTGRTVCNVRAGWIEVCCHSTRFTQFYTTGCS